MLQRFLTIFIGLILAFGAEAQTRHFHAQFRSLADGERIMYARVSDSKGNSYLTNSHGYVSLSVDLDDRIKVSHISYDTLSFNVARYPNRDTVIFYMVPRVFNIAEVSYSVLGARATFDNRFTELDLGPSDAERIKEKLEVEDMTSDLVALDRSAASGVRLGSPITAIYDRFSRSGKERRKYAILLAKDHQDSVTREKFNIDVVQQLTSFQDTLLTQDFMDFCSFDKSFVEQSEPITIYLEIIRCREEYLQLDY